jgi:endonuclease YncB( thermonuclease family)
VSDAGLWRYRAALKRVKDGDTIEVMVDLGFEIGFFTMAIRLLGLNCPKDGKNPEPGGPEATAYTTQWCQSALDPQTPWPLRVVTAKNDQPDKYGERWLGRIERGDGRCLNDDLIAAGHAVAWDGRGTKPV